MLVRPATPALTFTKFAPARSDASIKWVGSQIWQGAPRADSLLVADCIDEEWAKSLANSFNDATAMTAKIAAGNQVFRDMLAAISEPALSFKATDPQVAETFSALVA